MLTFSPAKKVLRPHAHGAAEVRRFAAWVLNVNNGHPPQGGLVQIEVMQLVQISESGGVAPV